MLEEEINLWPLKIRKIASSFGFSDSAPIKYVELGETCEEMPVCKTTSEENLQVHCTSAFDFTIQGNSLDFGFIYQRTLNYKLITLRFPIYRHTFYLMFNTELGVVRIERSLYLRENESNLAFRKLIWFFAQMGERCMVDSLIQKGKFEFESSHEKIELEILLKENEPA